MTIAVTGATGFVGQALLERAEHQGIPVKALTRRQQEPRQGVDWVRGDLEGIDPQQANRLLSPHPSHREALLYPLCP